MVVEASTPPQSSLLKRRREEEDKTGNLSSQRKTLLRPLFKYTPNAPGVITLTRNTVKNLKLWDHLVKVKEACPDLKMDQVESPVLNKLSQMCEGRVLMLLHLSIYRILKLTFQRTLAGLSTMVELQLALELEALDNPSGS